VLSPTESGYIIVFLLSWGLGLERGLKNKPVFFFGVRILGSSTGFTLKYSVFLIGSKLKK
jgi:hypothetical protein